MMPPWRSRARWWLVAGWLCFSVLQIPPTCFSPSASTRMMWSRVGSLTCLSKSAACCACLKRRPASVLALVDFVVVFAFVFAIGVSLSPGEYGQSRRLPFRSWKSLAGVYLIVIFGCAKINEFTMSGFLTVGDG